MKLLFTSKGLNTPKILEAFRNLLTKPLKYVNVQIFYDEPPIPNFDMRAYIDEDKQRLINLGIPLENIQEFDFCDEMPPNLDDIDVVFVLGGNEYQYMYHIRKLGYTSEIRKYVNSNKVYVGRSAGAVIMGPDIDIEHWSIFSNDFGLKDTSGFGFVDFITVPHIDTKKDPEKVLDFHRKTGHKMIYLTDKQGIVIIDDLYKIV